jgi:hypothetical protein
MLIRSDDWQGKLICRGITPPSRHQTWWCTHNHALGSFFLVSSSANRTPEASSRLDAKSPREPPSAIPFAWNIMMHWHAGACVQISRSNMNITPAHPQTLCAKLPCLTHMRGHLRTHPSHAAHSSWRQNPDRFEKSESR